MLMMLLHVWALLLLWWPTQGAHAAIIPTGFKSLLTSPSSFSASMGLKLRAGGSHWVPTNSPYAVSVLEGWAATNRLLSRDYTSNSTAVLLSSKLLHTRPLGDLGIKGANFNIPLDTNRGCFLPTNTQAMVVFNQSQPIVVDSARLRGEISLNFTGSYELMDYNLLVPLQFFERAGVSGETVGKYLADNEEEVLFYNAALEIRLPFLVIMISQTKGPTPQSASLSSVVMELFSKNWLGSHNSLNVARSMFCVAHNELAADSVCINVNDTSMSIFSPLNRQGVLNFQQPSLPDSLEVVDRTLEKRSYSGKLFNATRPVSVQLGSPLLDPNKQKFVNLTRCTERAKYKPAAPLEGSLGPPTELGTHYSEEMYQLRSHQITQVLPPQPPDNVPCTPLTWFNVFHRSLFGGDTDFCDK